MRPNRWRALGPLTMAHIVVTTAQMKAIEEQASLRLGLPLSSLMQSAGEALARFVQTLFPKGKIVVLCGGGGNGGDGFVAARWLHATGRAVTTVATKPPSQLSGDTRVMAEALTACGAAIYEAPHLDTLPSLSEADVIIDAILGIGVSTDITGAAHTLTMWAGKQTATIIAVDIPTGVCADTGRVFSGAIVADITFTLVAPKRGILLFPGANNAGKVYVQDLALPSYPANTHTCTLLSAQDFQAILPTRAQHKNANKGSHGRVLVVAGSASMPGAAILTATAALHAGAGYVTLISTTSVVQTAAGTAPEIVYSPINETPEGGLGAAEAIAKIQGTLGKIDAVAIGPGLGRAESIQTIVRYVLDHVAQPLVLDADALYTITPDIMEQRAQRGWVTIITPHPGEARSALGVDTETLDRVDAVQTLASKYHCIVLLKGARTLVANASGSTVFNRAGTPALGTAGSGDTLTGIIAALLSQRVTPLLATICAATLHSRAGELAALKCGLMSTSATDIRDAIGDAWMRLAAGEDTSPWIS